MIKHRFKILRTISIVFPILFASLFFVFITSYANHNASIVINEVCSNNFSIIQNQNGNYSDYIELYNAGSASVSLENYQILTESEKTNPYTFPDITMEPGSYLILINQPQSETSTEASVVVSAGSFYGLAIDFHVSKGGDTVYLLNSASKQIDAIQLPELIYDTVYARVIDGTADWSVLSATPGTSNNSAVAIEQTAAIDAPVFSVASGFYEDEFSVSISAPENCQIYYTLDGSTPTADSILYTTPPLITNISNSSNLYASRTDFTLDGTPISITPVEKAVILRAIAIAPDGSYSEVTSASYFVGDYPDLENHAVLSLITDPANLFSNETGIYVLGDTYNNYIAANGSLVYMMPANYLMTGRDWERPATISFFSADKTCLFSQDIGIRINGFTSRLNAQKSFRFYARDIYDGNEAFLYSLFSENVYPSSVILRAGSCQNQFLMELVSDLDIGAQDFIPCSLFINGEYWGLYYLQERISPDFIAYTYGVDSTQVAFIKENVLVSGNTQSYVDYMELVEFIQNHDLSVSENYNYVCSKLDIDNYIHYYCTQIYLNNRDYRIDKNCALWKSETIDESNPYADGKWRFLLYDLDYALNAASSYTTNSFVEKDLVKGSAPMTEPIFLGLWGSMEFRERFTTIFMDLANTCFRAEYVSSKIDSIDYFSGNENPDEWKEFFNYRFPYITKHLKNVFELSYTPAKVEVTTNLPLGGTIQINTITPDFTEGSWDGLYFPDYTVTLTAVPAEGYCFTGWKINDSNTFYSTQMTETFSFSSDGISIHAVFEKIEA